MNNCYRARIFNIYLLLCFIGILLAGCTSFGGAKGTSYKGLSEFREGFGQIYIYRPSDLLMSLAIPTLTIDGENATSIRNGSYMVYDLAPGKHKLVLAKNGNWSISNLAFDVDIGASQRKYFRLSADSKMAPFGQAISMYINGYLNRVPEEFAVTELPYLLFTGRWP